MRVLHVSEVSAGGVLSLLREFTAEQRRRNHDVHLLAPLELPGLDGVHHHRWDLDRRRPQTYPRTIAQYRRTLRAVRPDVVHLHSFMAGFFGRLAGLSVGTRPPVVYQPHAWSFDLYDDPRFRQLAQAWERFGGRHTEMLVANCADEVQEGRAVGVQTPAQVLGVAVDTQRFTPVDEATAQQHRQRLGVRAPRVLLCLGRLARQKGQDQLVEAWEKAPLPDTELVLVGLGDWETLRERAPLQWGRTIRVVDDQGDVRPWIWACDVLVLPSRYETVAIVVAEALACGRPVVATRANGVTEVVLGGSYEPAGAVVELGAMDQLLAQARRRLDDPELRRREGQAGRARAEALFGAAHVIDRLDDAYARAVAGSRTPS